MCTSSCPCESGEHQGHINAFEEVDEEQYNQFGRTKEDDESYLPFVWDGTMSSHKTVLECLEHVKVIKQSVDDYAMPTIPYVDFEISWGKDLINYYTDDQLDKIEEYDRRLTPQMRDQITFIESKYKCSGVCKYPFFYIS